MTRAAVQGQALFWAVLLEFFFVLMSVAMIVNYRRAARGTLDRNAYVGVRIPIPGRSREAWQAADRIAIRSIPIYVLFNAAVCAGLFAAAWHGWRVVVALVGGAGLFALFMLMAWTSYRANKAANAADHITGYRIKPSGATAQPLDRPARTRQLSDRQKTVLSWLCAVIACGLTLFLLGTIVDGYILAQHDQLVPADHFGFRDEATRACRPAWDASQKAGFSWMLFGYGPVLLASMVIFVGAAVQRRSPQDFVILAPGVVLAMLPFVIAAAIHADSVARSITC
jgi:hypothetical protein